MKVAAYCFLIGLFLILGMAAIASFTAQPPMANIKPASAVDLLEGELRKHSAPASTPYIGMSYTEFSALCNDSHDFSLRDRTTISDGEHESSFAILYREYTKKRGQSMCYGRFVFDLNGLTDITRSSQ